MEARLAQITSSATGHSATVKMSLHTDSATFSVLQSCDTAIKVNDSQLIPNGDAILEIVVDGRSHRRPIRVLDTGPRRGWLSIINQQA
jgi:hypothetical protein